MEKTEKNVISSEERPEVKQGWDVPHCLFIFGDEDSANNDLKDCFEIVE